MKKTITMIALALGLFTTKAQTVVADFESYTLAPGSAYTNTTSTPFQTGGASFQYHWDTGFSYWSGGFAYTNKYDSATNSPLTNLYGVKPLKGYNNSNLFVVGQDQGVINLSAPSNTVGGFYITNTTYAYKVIKNGNSFSRKFGDTTGTGSGTTIAQGSYPDFFKVTVKGYKAGVMLADSVPFYLADYRFANNALDYVVNTWQWVNTATLGNVDSLKFFMYTSDNGSFGPNTPLFFGMDNFTTTQSSVGLVEHINTLTVGVFPNPFNSVFTIQVDPKFETIATISEVTGKIIYSQQLTQMQTTLDVNALTNGVYFLEVSSGNQRSVKKLIKN
ncbi:MAG: DUF4465 domain-containing protein [Bacteroidetes bacterium]|nr:DUF4465 domain-containing protein [Bacteroidota bacterium]